MWVCTHLLVCVCVLVYLRENETEVESKAEKIVKGIKRGDESREKGRKTHTLSDCHGLWCVRVSLLPASAARQLPLSLRFFLNHPAGLCPMKQAQTLSRSSPQRRPALLTLHLTTHSLHRHTATVSDPLPARWQMMRSVSGIQTSNSSSTGQKTVVRYECTLFTSYWCKKKRLLHSYE